MKVKSVGIIGLGSFGLFLAELIPEDISVLGYDKVRPSGNKINFKSFKEVAQCDMVFLAVPYSSLSQVLKELADVIPPETLLVDICSVKVRPEQFVRSYLPNHHNILLCHPLFGPQTAKDGTEGHELVVTRSVGVLAEKVLLYCADNMGLKIHHFSSEDHDKVMAQVQSLTFFVARGLGDMDLGAVPFVTPSYNMLAKLIEFDRTHSNDLFDTIQLGNPYSAEIRKKFIKNLNDINDLMPEDANQKVNNEL